MDAVIQGTFADMKTVKTRKTLQIVLEVPIEMGEQVVRAFGFPDPSKEVNVAIARLQDKSVHEEVKSKSHAGEGKLLFKEDGFKSYLLANHYDYAASIDPFCLETAMKSIINITSCAELTEGSEAYDKFKAFRTDFYNWKRAKQQEEAYT